MFRLRGVIAGTHAFRCCPGLPGVELPEAHAVTEGIDVAAFRSVSIALDDGPDRGEPPELPAPGAYALPLRIPDYLIHGPAQAAALCRWGVLMDVPSQPAALLRVLAQDRPDELEEAFVEARARGPSWREAVDRGARRLPRDAKMALGDHTSHSGHHVARPGRIAFLAGGVV